MFWDAIVAKLQDYCQFLYKLGPASGFDFILTYVLLRGGCASDDEHDADSWQWGLANVRLASGFVKNDLGLQPVGSAMRSK